MRPEIAEKSDAVAAVCRRFRVARLELFGSAARGTDFNPERSDADFTVEYLPDSGVTALGHVRLARELGEALGRKVDLVAPAAVTNRYLLASINELRITVYEA